MEDDNWIEITYFDLMVEIACMLLLANLIAIN